MEPETKGDVGEAPVRDEKGRYVPGHAKTSNGCPYSLKVAAWRKAFVETVSPEDIAETIKELVTAAKAGQPWAVRELLSRCLGQPEMILALQADPESLLPLADQVGRGKIDLTNRVITALLGKTPEEILSGRNGKEQAKHDDPDSAS